MIRTEEFQAGPHRYRVTIFGARKGQAWLLRLTRAVAPAFVRANAGGESAVADALSELASSVDVALLEELSTALAGCCEVQTPSGTWVPLSPVYDDHFAGSYEDCVAWLRACLEANFSGFLNVLRQGAATKHG